MVKTLAKGDKPFDVIVPFWKFGHVIQILPKHLKIYQYKSCAESPGTHFIFRVALLVSSGKGANGQAISESLFTDAWKILKLESSFLFQFKSISQSVSAIL
jgi:hypothetical protein